MIHALVFAAAVAMSKPAPPPDLTAPPADAQKSADGLVSKQLEAGSSGEHPAAADYVHMRYAVWKASDASVVDYTRSEIPTFVEIAKLLPGMREMVELMTPGEKRRAWIPSSLGAGRRLAFDRHGSLLDRSGLRCRSLCVGRSADHDGNLNGTGQRSAPPSPTAP